MNCLLCAGELTWDEWERWWRERLGHRYRGIYWCREDKLWRVRIWVRGRRINLGYRKSAAEAALLYDAAALLYHGERARTNLVEGG